MEKTKNEFESGLKGFRGDLNLSLSVPNDPELLPYEVSNTISDLKDVKKKELEKDEVKEERSEGPKRLCESNAEVHII